MPKRKEKAAGYPRNSNPALFDSPTLESQAKAIRDHCTHEGYELTEDHMYSEAITAYMIPYTQRPRLMDLLAAAKRGEFTVLVVTEVRAISRRQVEVFVIYDILQRYGVRIETITEKFEDSAIGRFILATRAMVAELERENTYMRTQRGKRDRLENGNMNGHPHPAYGYRFLDTAKEKKAKYELDHMVIYVDHEGTPWTAVKVVEFIFSLSKQGESIRFITLRLNELGVPPPHKPRKGQAYWSPGTVYRILSNRVYIGEVYQNIYKREGRKMVKRDMSEWVLLPTGTAPALIERETFDFVQEQLANNKQDSLRNNKHPELLGIARSGYAICGICGRNMNIRHHNTGGRGGAEYACHRRSGINGVQQNHLVTIAVPVLDRACWKKVLEIVRQPTLVREAIASMREDNKPVVEDTQIEETIEDITRQLNNIIRLAQNATDNEMIDSLIGTMRALEKQKRDAEALAFDLEEDQEDREAVEAELTKFEAWVMKVQPYLTDPTYEPTYEEKRFAVRILGIRATVFPEKGEYPFRTQVGITVPAIAAKMKNSVAIDKWIEANGYSICGPTRELNLEYERGGDQAKFVTEVQFPVEKR